MTVWGATGTCLLIDVVGCSDWIIVDCFAGTTLSELWKGNI